MGWGITTDILSTFRSGRSASARSKAAHTLTDTSENDGTHNTHTYTHTQTRTHRRGQCSTITHTQFATNISCSTHTHFKLTGNRSSHKRGDTHTHADKHTLFQKLAGTNVLTRQRRNRSPT
jgi:hypothetical protein